MTFNPLNLIKLKEKYRIFKEEHPEMPAFGKALNRRALKVGSRFMIRAVTPEGKSIEREITLTENDVEMIRLFIAE